MSEPATHAPSWYHLNAGDAPQFPPPGGSCKADVCIVGGGFTGLSAALHLAEAGASVVLVEAGRMLHHRGSRGSDRIPTVAKREARDERDRLSNGASVDLARLQDYCIELETSDNQS